MPLFTVIIDLYAVSRCIGYVIMGADCIMMNNADVILLSRFQKKTPMLAGGMSCLLTFRRPSAKN